MCGIAGFVDFSCGTAAEALRRIAGDMADSLHHRGPDYGDVWIEAEASQMDVKWRTSNDGKHLLEASVPAGIRLLSSQGNR